MPSRAVPPRWRYEHVSIFIPPSVPMSSALLLSLTAPSSVTALAFVYRVQLPGVRSLTAAAAGVVVAGGAGALAGPLVGPPPVVVSVGPHPARTVVATTQT